MKATLIMLDKPILVNEEKPKYDDFMLCLDGIKQVYKCTPENFNLENFAKSSFVYKKILAGHEGTKPITFNLSDEDAKRIGYVDVEKEAKEYIDSLDWNMEDVDYKKNLQNCKYDVKKGIKLGLSLTPKKYTQEGMMDWVDFLDNFNVKKFGGYHHPTMDGSHIVKNKQIRDKIFAEFLTKRQPQQHQVECTETENEIIVTKIL